MWGKDRKGQRSVELKLASAVSDKEGFYKYINSKRRSKENIGAIFAEDGHLTDRDEDKQKLSMLFFASVFNDTDRPWAAKSSESEDPDRGGSDFPVVDTEIVRAQMYQLNIHKPTWPDGIHPTELKELSDVMAVPLFILCQRSLESGKVC